MLEDKYIKEFLENIQKDSDYLCENEIDEFITSLNSAPSISNAEPICHIIAEIAKSDYGRKKCSTENILSFLTSSVLPTSLKIDSGGCKINLTSVHACRAIGNICFDNDEGRMLADKFDGIKTIVTNLKYLSDNHLEQINHEDSIVCKDGSKVFIDDSKLCTDDSKVCIDDSINSLNLSKDNSKMSKDDTIDDINQTKKDIILISSLSYHRKVCLGCLFNFINDNEILSEKAVSYNLIETLSLYLDRFEKEKDLIDIVFNIIDYFLDLEFSRSKIVTKDMIPKVLKYIFNENEDLVEHTFQILVNMMESDVEKMVGLEGGIYEMLLEYIEKRSKEENKLLQLASDFIVLLLNADSSMQYLHEKGIIKIVLDWIQSNNNNLQISGAFALSNIARSDTTCKELMQNNVVEFVLKALDECPPENSEKQDLQHAFISVLRNLSVPVFNKIKLIQLDVIKKILPYITSSSQIIVFKTLITIRLLVDKQNLKETFLLQNEEFLNFILKSTENDENESVQSEAMRLLSNLIVQCDNDDVINYLLDNKAFDHMCEMMTSKHHIMIIESLQALNSFFNLVLDKINDLSLKQYASNITIVVSHITANKDNINTITSILNILKNCIIHEKVKSCLVESELSIPLKAWSSDSNTEISNLCEDILLLLKS